MERVKTNKRRVKMSRYIYVYIAGPIYDRDPEKQSKKVNFAIDCNVALVKQGYIPFCPHLNMDGVAFEYQEGVVREAEWLRHDLAWLKKCDCVLLLERSAGADAECAYAEAMGIPIMRSMEELEKFRDVWGEEEKRNELHKVYRNVVESAEKIEQIARGENYQREKGECDDYENN